MSESDKTPAEKVEKKHKPLSPNMRRSMARIAAVQALFQVEFNQASANTVVNEFLNDRVSEDLDGLRLKGLDQSLFLELLKGLMQERELTADMVASVLDKDWTMDRLDPLLRLIMQAGAYEIQLRPDVPARVVISEYVDIAHAYFGNKETAMVNGVLDKLAHARRADEFEK
ncbi:transcription antitermination factor NusB [Kiloniella sp. b19]|uniref:transcription antitermination factor NusB n=1 Tax=Kiloniella sp. GXU_MW_B19 TaxID=3141326 RepID=UPI0031E238BF